MKVKPVEKIEAAEKVQLSERPGRNPLELFNSQSKEGEADGSFKAIAEAKAAKNRLEVRQPAKSVKVSKPFVELVKEEESIYHRPKEDGLTGPTKEERRQFQAEQKAKRERRKRYIKILEEAALKRRLDEQERNKKHYKNMDEKELVEEAHKKNIMGLPPEKRDSNKKVFGYEAPNGAEEAKAALLEAEMALAKNRV